MDKEGGRGPERKSPGFVIFFRENSTCLPEICQLTLCQVACLHGRCPPPLLPTWIEIPFPYKVFLPGGIKEPFSLFPIYGSCSYWTLFPNFSLCLTGEFFFLKGPPMMPTRLQFLSFANKKRIFIRVLYYSFFVSFLFAERGAALRRLRQQGIEATQPAQVSSTTGLPHKVFSRKKIKLFFFVTFFSVFIPLALREK